MTATSTLATLLSLTLNHDWSVSLTLNPVALAMIITLALVAGATYWFFTRRANFELDTAQLGIGSQTLTFKPNTRDLEIAYKIWVELSTRKIGLAINLEHDVIAEVYDSWHSFFGVTRELIKDIPVNKVRHPSTRKIITLSIDVLNKGLRPHLTQWQARFRRWYDKQLEKASDDVDPQSLQSQYPKYADLKKDLLEVNGRLMAYREVMRKLVLGLNEDDTIASPPESPTL